MIRDLLEDNPQETNRPVSASQVKVDRWERAVERKVIQKFAKALGNRRIVLAFQIVFCAISKTVAPYSTNLICRDHCCPCRVLAGFSFVRRSSVLCRLHLLASRRPARGIPLQDSNWRARIVDYLRCTCSCLIQYLVMKVTRLCVCSLVGYNIAVGFT